MYYVDNLHKKYGPLVRIAPNQLASSSPQDFNTIHRVGSGFNKTQWYEDWTRGKDGEGIGIGLFAMRDPKQAAARRRMFARALAVSSIRGNYEGVVKEKVTVAVEKIKNELYNHGESNVMKWWVLMASDVIGQLSFGESFEQLQLGKASCKAHSTLSWERANMSSEISLHRGSRSGGTGCHTQLRILCHHVRR